MMSDEKAPGPVVVAFPQPGPTYPYKWRTHKLLSERFGQKCRIVPQPLHENGAWSFGMLTREVLVAFEDGVQVRTFRGYVRRRQTR